MRTCSRNVLASLVVGASLTLLLPTSSSAQATVVTLTGRVVDPQNAAAPAATLTLRNQATSATWTATTDAGGRFTVTMLPPGTYAARVELAGFSPWQADGIALQTGQTRHLDVRLAIGGLQDAVTVADVSRPATTVVDEVLPADEILSLPLNGRNFLELALLVPGSQPTPTFDPTKTNSVLISSAGHLGRSGSITIDGQNTNDDVVGGPLLNLPIDAVQEFQIATNRFGADTGRTGTSAINVITRSGGSTHRGSASLFARDSAWQAGSPLVDPHAEEMPFDRQQFSMSAGGPLRRDGVFWFAAAEVRNQDGALLVGTRDLATRTIRSSLAPAPLDDTLWTVRIDTAGTADRLSLRYAGEHARDTATSAIERSLGSASQRQAATNGYHHVLGTWTSTRSASFVNALHAGVGTFQNETVPLGTGPQLTFPSLVDGASFRMPQQTTQRRFEVTDNATMVRGPHTIKFGGTFERIDGRFDLGVFQLGRIELVQDFATFDHTGDGVVDDGDLLFGVTLRSGRPDRALELPDSDNTHYAAYVQDDVGLTDRVQLNVGLRYELDTEVNNQSRLDGLNPLVAPFVEGERHRDANNLAPRIGVAWSATEAGRLVLRGGYGVYYDRIVLQIQSLERGLDGRALPIEVRLGNAAFVDPDTGQLPPFAPTTANPFIGPILPGEGASGINIIDPELQSPMVHQFHAGVEATILEAQARVDVLHASGRNFLIGRPVGEVFNPVVGGPDRVVNIESSGETMYDALLLSLDRRLVRGSSVRVAYTLSKSFTYVNDEQIPFLHTLVDPDDLRREFGPAPNDRRHRFVVSGQATVPGDVRVAGIWTLSSGVPMDVLMPDGTRRVPVLQRNAGGRLFDDAPDLNAFITDVNASGGIDGVLLPLVPQTARFNDTFNAVDIRITRPFTVGGQFRIEPMVEIFNLFDVTNILGVSNGNYSGFSNVLVRDSDDPGDAGYLTSSRFGLPVTTAGGVFGSGGPRAVQFGVRATF
jgi:hypothetical protein